MRRGQKVQRVEDSFSGGPVLEKNAIFPTPQPTQESEKAGEVTWEMHIPFNKKNEFIFEKVRRQVRG